MKANLETRHLLLNLLVVGKDNKGCVDYRGDYNA
jgi:hypothetical protein